MGTDARSRTGFQTALFPSSSNVHGNVNGWNQNKWDRQYAPSLSMYIWTAQSPSPIVRLTGCKPTSRAMMLRLKVLCTMPGVMFVRTSAQVSARCLHVPQFDGDTRRAIMALSRHATCVAGTRRLARRSEYMLATEKKILGSDFHKETGEPLRVKGLRHTILAQIFGKGHRPTRRRGHSNSQGHRPRPVAPSNRVCLGACCVCTAGGVGAC